MRDTSGEYPTRCNSEPSMNALLNISELGRIWATSGNLLGMWESREPTKVIKVKKVTFQTLIRVVLIPSKDEYVHAGLFDALWWRDLDYSTFKFSAFTELKALMSSRNIKNSQEAIIILYQPRIENDANNPDRETTTPCSTGSPLPAIKASCNAVYTKEPVMASIAVDLDLADLKLCRLGSLTTQELIMS